MKADYKIPKVTLVGAGPGAIDLMTIKGMEALKHADVVVYDALANPEFLSFAPSSAKKIFVGKRAGKHSFSQDEINDILYRQALLHGHVVRLKGGDSFVFGRGHEEMQYLEKRKIYVEIVPGISSCISVPELQKIPVTRRNVSDSFWVITATKKNHELSKDLHLAAQSSATVVILMGLRKLPEIVKMYQTMNLENEAIMVVQSGSTTEEKHVVGEMKEIESLVAEKNISTPALIVIGDVVRLHADWVKQKVTTEFSDHSILVA